MLVLRSLDIHNFFLFLFVNDFRNLPFSIHCWTPLVLILFGEKWGNSMVISSANLFNWIKEWCDIGNTTGSRNDATLGIINRWERELLDSIVVGGSKKTMPFKLFCGGTALALKGCGGNIRQHARSPGKTVRFGTLIFLYHNGKQCGANLRFQACNPGKMVKFVRWILLYHNGNQCGADFRFHVCNPDRTTKFTSLIIFYHNRVGQMLSEGYRSYIYWKIYFDYHQYH